MTNETKSPGVASEWDEHWRSARHVFPQALVRVLPMEVFEAMFYAGARAVMKVLAEGTAKGHSQGEAAYDQIMADLRAHTDKMVRVVAEHAAGGDDDPLI